MKEQAKTIPTDLEYESDLPLIENNAKSASYRSKMKYPALILACLLSIGSYFCYDNPSALESHLTDPNGTFKLDHVSYSLLYSVYALPNTILPFFGGFLVDKMGVRLGIFIFSLLLTIGQLVILLGAVTTEFSLLLVGRILFGIGGESLNVTQTTVIAHWFSDSNISFAIGLNIAIARIGSVMNSALTPTLYSISNSYFLPLFVGLLLCVGSFLCGVALCILDKKAEKKEHEKNQETSDKIRIKDLKTFKLMFWSMVLNCMLTYGSFYTFNANANDILYKNFNISNESAGLYLMVVFLIAALVTPIFGVIFDKIGQRALALVFSVVVLTVALLIICFLPSQIESPLILLPLLLLGIFYPTYAAVFWPSVPKVVEKKTLGSAYGLLMSFQNLGIAISPLIFGAIQNNHYLLNKEYFFPLIYLIFQAILSIFVAVLINIVDFRNGDKLNQVVKKNNK